MASSKVLEDGASVAKPEETSVSFPNQRGSAMADMFKGERISFHLIARAKSVVGRLLMVQFYPSRIPAEAFARKWTPDDQVWLTPRSRDGLMPGCTLGALHGSSDLHYRL